MSDPNLDLTILKQSTILTALHFFQIAHNTSLSLWDAVSLLVLDQAGPLQPRELAEVTQFPTGQITKIADRLESAGYIRRTKHPTDRRAVVLAVRPAGRRAVAKWLKPIAASWAHEVQSLGADDGRRALDLYAEVIRGQWNDRFTDR